MIKYLENRDIDYDKWDRCITESFNGNAYAMSWYLDLVFDSWSALVEDDYLRVMPLMITKKWGISYFYQPFFIQQLGVFSRSMLNPDVVEEFVNAIPERVKVININLNVFNRVYENKFEVKYNDNYELDLIGDYAKLFSAYSTNQKRNVRKAIKNNLSFSKSAKPESVIQLFRESKGTEIRKWGDEQYVMLQRLMYSAIHKGRGSVYSVYGKENQLLAAAFFVMHNKKIIFLFSGTSKDARNTGALSYLIDQVIKKYSSQGWILDFEGSNDANLARYYKGFGAKKTIYYSIMVNRFNPFLRWIYKIYNHFFS